MLNYVFVGTLSLQLVWFFDLDRYAPILLRSTMLSSDTRARKKDSGRSFFSFNVTKTTTMLIATAAIVSTCPSIILNDCALPLPWVL